MNTPRIPQFLRIVGMIVLLLAVAGGLLAIQTQEVDLGRAGNYDGKVMITRDSLGHLTFRDNQVTTATTLATLLASKSSFIEQFATQGAAGTAPVSNGAGVLTMTAVPTLSTLNAKADQTTTIAAGAGLTGGGDLSANRTLALDYTSTLAGNPAMNGGEARFGTTGLLFEGATADNNEGLLTAADPTADRTWTLPNASGTVAVSASSPLSLSAAGDLSLGQVNLASGVTGTLPVGSGGSGTATAFTAGSVVFAGASGVYSQDNSNFFWDATNHRLGIGTTTPANLLTINQGSSATAGFQFVTATTGQTLSDGFTIIGDTGNGDIYLNQRENAAMRLWVNGAEKLTILPGGNVGIAGASPAEKLDVVTGNARVKAGTLQVGNAAAPAYNRLGTASTNHSLAAASDLLVGGKLEVQGDLYADGTIWRNGQRLISAVNLLDNPDFNIWQRNITMSAASGGDSGGTLTYPVPATLSLGADRWQASRSKTDMTATISRDTPPATLPTAQYVMKLVATAGAPCRFYVHQTLTRQRTRGLRGKWVTFAASVYETGTGGGNLALYKTVGGAVTELARYTFASTANGWDRIAVTAQVPTDADCLLVSIQPELSTSGTTTAYLANATLLEGKYVNTTERVTDPATASVPPLSKDPTADLASCQAFCEKGSFMFTVYSPDTNTNFYDSYIKYSTAKQGASTITIDNLGAPDISSPIVQTQERPSFTDGRTFPTGFIFDLEGSTSAPESLAIGADWIAVCAEPI